MKVFGSIQNLAAFVGKGAMNYIAPTQKERWLNKKCSHRGKLHVQLYKNIELHATGMKRWWSVMICYGKCAPKKPTKHIKKSTKKRIWN
jgi:hypothetical protein